MNRNKKFVIASLLVVNEIKSELEPIKRPHPPELQIAPFVGWVEAIDRRVGFRTSTQPTQFAAIQRLPAYGRNPT